MTISWILRESITKQTIVAGGISDLAAFSQACQNQNIKTSPLSVSHGFHSRYMEPMPEFHKVASQFSYQTPRIPIISTVSGQFLSEVHADYWTQQIRSTVDFSGAISGLPADDLSFLEIGPQPILMQMAKRNRQNNDEYLSSLSPKIDNRLSLLQSLQALSCRYSINWDQVNFQGSTHIS